MRDGFARVFGRARKLKRLGSVEGGREADFAGFLRVGLVRRDQVSVEKGGGENIRL